jgi:lipooligosaccharide transport system permease protein
MLANAAMNGAIFDTTYNFFSKLKYGKTYDGMLATPLDAHDIARGEVLWALARGGVYAIGFLLVMVAFGLVVSPWGVLVVPVALLIGFAFAGMGLGATTYMRSFLDFDKVAMAIVPLFLFSATFFPLERYPDALAWVVRCSPLYQGVVLCRALTLGEVHPALLLNVAYLAAMGYAGTRLASRRITQLLQP